VTIAAAITVGKKLASGNFGYGQDDRKSAWNDNGKLGLAGLREPGDSDCTFSTALIYYLASLIPRSVLTGTIYSGNFGPALGATGMVDRINVRNLSLAQINAKAKPADAIYGPGHAMFHLGGGKWLSFETTEKGKSTGGKLGRQKGEGVRTRSLYVRGASSRSKAKSKTGWSELIRPKSPATLLGALLAAYGKGKDTKAAQARVTLRSPWDGPRYAEMMAEWAALDKGVPVTYDATKLTVPQTGHMFVVLGGTPTQMDRRLSAALPAILANPASKVIVTGAPIRDGKTEAAWMRDWLIAAAGKAASDGFVPDLAKTDDENAADKDKAVAAAKSVMQKRVIVEARAQSTIGNALYSVDLMRQWNLTSYTLVSYASHLRRAAILFRAALAKAETADNKRRSIAATTCIAWDDYGTQPHASTLPIDSATRAQYAGYVASLLGVSAQYKSAL
jgi:uncharacterized SAM-binding protein YcdF (DUF218 family)